MGWDIPIKSQIPLKLLNKYYGSGLKLTTDLRHGVSGLSDPLNLELGTDGIYATGDSTHTLQIINGLTQLVKSDDLTNVLCYAKNRNTCMDRDVAYSCFKTAKIRGFASRWQNNYDMKVECVNMC